MPPRPWTGRESISSPTTDRCKTKSTKPGGWISCVGHTCRSHLSVYSRRPNTSYRCFQGRGGRRKGTPPDHTSRRNVFHQTKHRGVRWGPGGRRLGKDPGHTSRRVVCSQTRLRDAWGDRAAGDMAHLQVTPPGQVYSPKRNPEVFGGSGRAVKGSTSRPHL